MSHRWKLHCEKKGKKNKHFLSLKQSRENVKISEIACSEETALLRDSRLKYISSGNISEVLGRDSGRQIFRRCVAPLKFYTIFFLNCLGRLAEWFKWLCVHCSFSHPSFHILSSVLSVAAEGHQVSQQALRTVDQKTAVCSPSLDVSAWEPATSLWNMSFFAVMGGDALRDEAPDPSL